MNSVMYNVPVELIDFIIAGDDGMISSAERRSAKQFMAQVRHTHGPGLWHVVEDSEGEKIDSIYSGLNNCVTVTYTVYREGAPFDPASR